MTSNLGEGPKRVRALIVEDSDDDAWLLTRELQRAGWLVDWLRIESADELRAALVERVWDVVIADFRLPHFSAPEALAILNETGRDIPFIVVSGAVGEEVAVELMRSGAHDYVPKTSLARLGPAVTRELQEATVRQARRAEADAQRIFRGGWRRAGRIAALRRHAAHGGLHGRTRFRRRVRPRDLTSPMGRSAAWASCMQAVDDGSNAEELSAPLMVRGALLGTLRYARTRTGPTLRPRGRGDRQRAGAPRRGRHRQRALVRSRADRARAGPGSRSGARRVPVRRFARAAHAGDGHSWRSAGAAAPPAARRAGARTARELTDHARPVPAFD